MVFPPRIDTSGGAIVIADNHIFADTTARDAYFVSNPSELINDVYCYITGTLSLQQYKTSITTWLDMTPAIIGQTGPQGIQGATGSFPTIHDLTEKTSPSNDDVFIIEDSLNSFATKKIKFSSINKGLWGEINGTLADQTDLQQALDGKAPVASYGYAPLDSTSKIPSSYLPALAITTVIVSETEPGTPTEGMLWIKPSTGVSKVYDADTTTWYELANPSGYVTTVNGESGPTVALTALDIPTDTTNFDNNLSSSDTDVQKALQTLNDMVTSVSNDLGWFEDSTDLIAAYPTALVGNYATVGTTDTVWIWSGTAWADSGRKGEGVQALSPVNHNCLLAWNDNYGSYAKNADSGAYVENGLFVKIPHSSGVGKYKLKTYGCPWTTSYAGIVDLAGYLNLGESYYSPDDYGATSVGFVANMIDSVNSSEFGGGLLIGYNRVGIAVKPKGGAVYEAIIVYSDGIVTCPAGVYAGTINIPSGQTYNINGSPHVHNQYLPLAGGTLTGDINADSHKITNVGSPTNGGDAVNLDYLSGFVVGITWVDPVESIENEPPTIDGRYLVAASGTSGDFVGHENEFATLNTTWTFGEPVIGMAMLNKETGFTYVFNGTSWSQMSGSVSHSSLSGLTTSDDHTQYVHNSSARTISAQHTFSNAGAPFIVNSDTVVTNLNADKVDGKDASEFATAIHYHALGDLTNVLITSPTEGDILAYDLATEKFINVENVAAFSINPNHQFATDGDRDTYFALHPEELVDGILIAVGTGFEQRVSDTWVDRTAVVRGPAGTNGADGADGADGAQGPQGEQGEQGPQGIQGPAGASGTNINLLGEVDYPTDLPETATLHDAYVVNSDGDLYIWGDDSAWHNIGMVAGPQGIQGIQGVQGSQGIQGVQGIKGDTGATGPKGDPGARGPAGAGPECWQIQIEDIVNEPPAVYDINDRFIVSGTPSGAFTGHAHEVVTWLESLEWFFETPDIGWTAFNFTTENLNYFTGTDWEEMKGAGYVLPVASASTLGGVKQGTNVTISEFGTISVDEIPSSFLDLTDTPSSYGYALQVVRLNSGANGLEFATPEAGESTFIDLTDTPASYTSGDAGKYVKVNATYNALEFASLEIASAFTDLTDAPASYSVDDVGKAVVVNDTYDGLEFVDVTPIYKSVSVDYTFPSPAVEGTVVDVVGKGTNWIMTATDDTNIRMGADESATNGTISSTNGYDCATFIYIGNSKWVVKSVVGSLTIDAV